MPHLEEMLFRRRIDLNDLVPPWTIKTHLNYETMPKLPVKYIYVLRHGLDVAVSYYHHHLRCMPNPPGSFEQFFSRFLLGQVPYGSWFTHVANWIRNTNGLEVLVVRYEDMVQDLRGAVSKVVAFCQLDVPEKEWPRILRNCSFEFMKKHDSKFDIRSQSGPSPADGFIRRGTVAQWPEYLNDAMLRDYNSEFDRTIDLETLRSYRAEIR
jgi:hypothetical protein